ncbi:hypothetical protein C0992_006074 [Termitomyces sp. T32_za158]|nr:hypothetical protein C0992_006074 [Termitomyces sp. T32_za158]
MYAEFAQWVREKSAAIPLETEHDATSEERQLAFREHVLVHFNKRQEYDMMVCKQKERTRLKKVFNGSIVRQWANLGEDWKTLKLVMDMVREELGGDRGILKLYDELGESGLRHFVSEVQQRSSLVK